MDAQYAKSHITKVSLAGLIITMGIVYGDIGTSPLYVMKAIIGGAPRSVDFILGAISCIIWTLTLQTTLKYVIITLKADNNGEGGIFALYALLRKNKKGVFILAIIGGSALLADGVITPSITVTSAIEGLDLISDQIPVLPIVIGIITLLFISQQFGTNVLGKSFGPIMFLWFGMLAVLGLVHIAHYPAIFKAINPYYAINLLTAYPGGFILLGAVFLCTTGAEALYSDLGHCGIKNIRISWFYVKFTLILNYLGQGAWIICNPSVIEKGLNPFFSIMPHWFLLTGVIVATTAAVIASQALISGSFTLISEAIPLNFWPKVKIMYPTNIKGQMYVPFVNWFLFFSCIFVIIFFKNSSNMEAAYGLAITITMLMTTLLMTYHLFYKRRPFWSLLLFICCYLTIEGAFLIANLNKFLHGGWFTLLLAGLIALVMFVWFKGREIKKQYTKFIKINDYFEVLKDLSKDESIPKFATNLVYMTRADYNTDVESKIIYSIINKQPKRADKYWFVHVHILDEPRTMEYSIEKLIPDTLYRVELRMGFKMNPKVNLYFRQAIEDMVNDKELDLLSNYPSLRKHAIMGDFKFIMIDRIQTADFDFPGFDQFIMNLYELFRKIGIPEIKALGLDTSNVMVEKVPLIVKGVPQVKMKRLYYEQPPVPAVDAVHVELD